MQQWIESEIKISDRFGVNPTLFLIKITTRNVHIKGNLYEVIIQKGYFGKTYRGKITAKNITDVMAAVVKKIGAL